MRILTAIALSAVLAAATPALHANAFAMPQSGKQQQVKLIKGTWWGAVGDRVEMVVKDQLATRTMTGTVTKIDSDKGILTMDVEIDGKKTTRQIFTSTIVSIKPAGGAAAPATVGAAPQTTTDAVTATDGKPAPSTGVPTGTPSGKVDAQGYQLDENGYRIAPQKGVFVLPFVGPVGATARAYEIEQMGKEADNWGPNQIIILDIDSPGGLVTEIFKIVEAIKSVRERHRMVAWVKEAISAAAVTSMQFDEIYFRTTGADGAAMMISGSDSVYGEQLDKFKDEIGATVEENGRPRCVFLAMVLAKDVLTYTKDPVTGKPTFHDKITGLPGEIILSNDKENLVFNASTALDSGFSQGTADTGAELAPLLGLKEWYEISDYGRKTAAAWKKLYEDCDKDFKLQQQFMNIPRAGGAVEQITAEIQILEKILDWNKKCKPCIEGKIGPQGVQGIEKELKDLRKQLGELRKRAKSSDG
jgi:membrane-bound ClpP family serine protease